MSINLFPNDKLVQTEIVADVEFKFDENGRNLYDEVENMVGKEKIARHKQFLLFPVFSKDLYCRACLENG